MKPTYSYTKRLIAHILLWSLLLQSCYNPSTPLPYRPPQEEQTVRTTSYPLQGNRAQEACISHSHEIAQLSSQSDPVASTQLSNKKPLTERKLLQIRDQHPSTIKPIHAKHVESSAYQTKKGYNIQFSKVENAWISQVIDNTFPGFQRSFILPVYGIGMDLEAFFLYPNCIGQQYIHVYPPTKNNPGKVLVGQLGLLGGGGDIAQADEVIKNTASAFANIQAEVQKTPLHSSASEAELKRQIQKLNGLKDELEQRLIALDFLTEIDQANRAKRKLLIDKIEIFMDQDLKEEFKKLQQKLNSLPQQNTTNRKESKPTATNSDDQNTKEEQTNSVHSEAAQATATSSDDQKLQEDHIRKTLDKISKALPDEQKERLKELLEGIKGEIAKNSQLILEEAISNNNVSMVKALIAIGLLSENGEAFEEVDCAYNIYDALEQAIDEDKEEIVKMLVQEFHAKIIEGGDFDNWLLCQVIEKGKIAMVQTLLALGADVEARDANGNSPLAIAVEEDDKEIVKLLVQTGDADINRKSDYDNLTLFDLVIHQGNTSMLRTLIALGADVETIGDNDFTPLQYAARRGEEEIVKILVQEGKADLNTKDQEGYTPFHIAVAYGHLAVAQQLIALGADIKAKTSNAANALQLAAENGHADMLEWLLQQGLTINARNNTSHLPLHIAAAQGKLSAVQKLLDHGANLYLADSKGKTPLHLSAQNNHIDISAALINKGASIIVTDNRGHTPMYGAIQQGHFELVAQCSSQVIAQYKTLKQNSKPHTNPFKHKEVINCIAYIEAYYAQRVVEEQESNLIQNFILPLLKTHLATASAEIQASFIAYIQAGNLIYLDTLQTFPVEEWVNTLLLRSMLEAEKDNHKQQRSFHRLQPIINSLSHTWHSPIDVTHFLFSLYDKQLIHQLSLETIEDILTMVASLPKEDALYCIAMDDEQWMLLLKHAWLLHQMPDANLWHKLVDKQQVAAKKQLFHTLLHLPYSSNTLASLVTIIQEEKNVEPIKDLIQFAAKYTISDSTILDGLHYLSIFPPTEKLQKLQAWKQNRACDLLSQELIKISPTHGPPLYDYFAFLIQHGCNYDCIYDFLSPYSAPKASNRFQYHTSELKTVLELLTTYHPAVAVCEAALQFLTQEKDHHKWESAIHRKVIEATFLEAHERSIDEINTYIAEKSPDTYFAGDTKALHTAYNQVCEAYAKTTSLRDLTIKTTKKSDDGSEDITQEHTISAPSGSIKNWQKSEITQWANAVKTHIQQRGISSVPQAEMIAVLKQAVYLEYGYYPRDTQIMTLLAALNHVENQGRLLQVNTGEGKSLIIAMLATIHALQGKKVDIVTSSIELSMPEAARKSSFFALFGLTVGENSTKLREEDDNSDNDNDAAADTKQKEADKDKKAVYHRNILYGIASDFQADILKTEFFGNDIRGDRGFGVVLVDEVDNLLFDERNASLKISSPTPGMNHLELVLATIWKYVNEIVRYIIAIEGKTYFITEDFKIENGKIQLFTDTPLADCMREIEDQDDFIKKNVDPSFRAYLPKIEIPNHLKDFVHQQIPHWIDSAITGCKLQKEVHYDIVKGKIVPIDYANTGVLQISMVWSDGLAQMLQMKEGLPLEPENLSNNFISTAGFFKRYGTDIYGLTGTLGNNSTRSFFREVYDVDMVTIPPYKKLAITGNEQSLYQCKELTANISHTQPAWVEAIITSSLQKAQQGRAVLMLCQYIDQVKKLQKIFAQVYDTGKIFMYTGQEAFHKHHIDAGEIIIATNISGRGTDLKTSTAVEKNGGMHVCLTFLPSSYRVELQNAGRTAREGKKGTAQLVLYNSDTTQTIEKLRQKRDEEEIQRLEKAKHDVKDILFKDDLFTKFCALEHEFFPPAGEQNKIDQTHMLNVGWQKILRERLAPEKTKALYEEAIKEKANEIFEPLIEQLIKDKYVQRHDYAARAKKLNEIVTKLKQENPEETIRKTHEEHVFNDFCCQMKGVVLPDVLICFQEKRGTPSSTKPSGKEFKGYERQGLEERWGFWLNKTLHQSKSLYDRKEEVLRSFDQFVQKIRSDAKEDNLVENPYFYTAKGLQLMECAEEDEHPSKAFDKAIKLDPTFSTEARYNMVAVMLKPSDNKEQHDDAKKELEKTKEILERVHKSNLTAIHALTATGSSRPALSQHLQHQIDIISAQVNYIDGALETLAKAKEKEWNVEITSEDSLEEAICKKPTGEGEEPLLCRYEVKKYKPAIKKANIHGLNNLFTIAEKKTIPWTAVLTVGLLGLAQIVAGVCLAGLSGGLLGSSLISQGVSDIITAVKAAFSGSFSWAEWGMQKAISIVTDLICMGIAKIKEGFSKIGANIAKGAHKFKAGVDIAIEQVKLIFTKEVPRACFQAAADYVLSKTVIASIQEAIEKKVTQELTEALENNSFVQQGLDLDNAQGHNMWQQKFMHEGLQLLKEEESQWKTLAVEVAKGVASNKIQGFSAVMKFVEGSKALIDLVTYTNQFVHKWEKNIKSKYETELKEAQKKHEDKQKQATQQKTTTQQKQSSSSASSSQQYSTSSTFTDTTGAQIPTSRPEGYTSKREEATPLNSRFDKKGPSKRKNIADSFADVITGKLTNNIQGKIFTPMTSKLIDMGIEKMTAEATRSLQAAQEAYRQECHEYYVADEIQKAQKKADKQAAKNPQADASKPKEKNQKPVDPYIQAKIDQIRAGKEGDIADLSGIAGQAKRPIYIYDAEGKLYDTIGEVYRKPLTKGDPQVEPIKLQHITNPDGTGHWQSYDSKNPVASTGKTNCLYDACASQLSEAEKAKIGIHTGADLREKTVETFIANPKLATELFQTADRLSFIKPDALKVGGSAMSVTADGMLLADKWLKAHPTVKDIVDGLGKGASAALWLKYAKTVGPAGFLTGLVVDYGYDKLIENFHLDTAKEHFAAYLLSKDSDLNKEQADILASAAIKVTKEAGRILTHKMAANGVQALRKHFAEKGPKVFKAPEVSLKEGAKPEQTMPSEIHTQITPKIIKQTESRGWTKELIHETVNNPFTIRLATNKATGNTATVYFQKNGSYIIKDNITNEVIQVSNRLDPNWIPDNTIVNPYIPK